MTDSSFLTTARTTRTCTLAPTGSSRLSTRTTTPDNSDLTNTPLETSILPFWDDLLTGSGDTEAVFWELTGKEDNQVLTIQWNDVRLDGLAGADDPPLTFQVVLYEKDGTVQFNYQTVTGTQFIGSAEAPIGTFKSGNQTRPEIASDAAGNSIVVWESPGQSPEGGTAIFARRFDPLGNAIGNEFQVSPGGFEYLLPKVAMNATGETVVTWLEASQRHVFAQRLDNTGQLVGDPIQVSTIQPGDTREGAPVVVDSLGGFSVAWGEGRLAEDIAATVFRRFDANGDPIDAVDEIQEIEFLGPPAVGSRFTLVHNGSQTGLIAYAANNGSITAQNIQTALQALQQSNQQSVDGHRVGSHGGSNHLADRSTDGWNILADLSGRRDRQSHHLQSRRPGCQRFGDSNGATKPSQYRSLADRDGDEHQ